MILKQQSHQEKRGGSKAQNDLHSIGKQAAYTNCHKLMATGGKRGRR